jgi:chromosome segregation ATPase
MSADETLGIKIEMSGDLTAGREAEKVVKNIEGAADSTGGALQRNLGDAAEASLNKVSEAADKTSTSLSSVKSASEFDAARSAELTRIAQALLEANQNAEQASLKLGKVKEGIEGLNAAARGGPGAIMGLSKALDGLGGQFSELAVQAGLIGGALSAGFAAGSLVYSSIVDPIWTAIEQSQEKVSAFTSETKAKIEALAEVELEFKGIDAAIEQASGRFDALIERMRQVQSGASELAGARDSLELKKLEASEKRELMGAGGNAELEASIKARYAEERAKVQIAAEERRINEQIKQTSTEISLKTDERKALETQLTAATKEAKEAMEQYRDRLTLLASAGYDTQKLASDVSGRDAAINEARSKLDKSEAAYASGSGSFDQVAKDTQLLKALTDFAPAMKAAVEAQNKSEAIQKDMVTKLGDVAREIIDLKTKLSTLEVKKQEVQEDKAAKALELGADSKEALNGLEQAIREQEAKVSASREGVSRAQAGGSMLDQNFAQAELAKQEAALASLRAAQEKAAKQVTESATAFGQSYIDGATIISGKVSEVQGSIEKSNEEISGASEKAVQDITAGSDAIKETIGTHVGDIKTSTETLSRETTDSVNGMVAAQKEWGSKVIGLIDAQTNAMSALSSSVSSLLSKTQSLESAAARIGSDASLALQQIRNMNR